MRQKGNISQALEYLKKCHLFNTANPEVLKHVSKTLLLQGKYKESIDVANEAIKLNEQDWENYSIQADCYLNLKNDEKALQLLQKANQISQHEQTYIQLGRYYYVRKMYDEAIQTYQEGLKSALSIEPNDAISLLAVSSIMQDQSEYDKALNKYRKMALTNPDSSQLWNNIAMCFYGKEKYLNAITCLKKALYLDPFEFLTCLNLGLVFYTQKQYASAFHYFSASIELNPDFAITYMYIGLCLNQLNDIRNACISFETAQEKNDQDEYIIPLNYAILLAQRPEQEYQDKAVQQAQLFVQLSRLDGEIRFNVEDIEKQKQLLQQLLKVDLSQAR
ncbi:hypothetical protein PPERSA_04072 [Pseudocohnilembus persalinus]|uniref:Uncharacterized protein n=1 Tax=Pseudocohnilembus persalinus TaxID=266149 RepID=A0A0V0QLN4_PSEPJ|nr:hypothetical protein PPERSA_04072 [Pseudocohnilembus persalinus]|eukprot:KRX02869.1 hypothetical protein PPERSA_04072 [Pseudocohnilembus persalinus]